MSFLTRLSLRNRALIGLLTFLVVVAGVITATSIRQELIPSIESQGAMVTVQAQGTSPDSVARDIAEPIENAVRGVSDVEQVTSTSTSGSAQVTVSWKFGVDTDPQLNKV